MTKLFTLTAALLLLLLGTHSAQADDRDRWDRWDRGTPHFDDRGRGRGWAFGRRDRDGWDRRDRDRVSVNVSIGNIIPDWRYRDYRRATSGLGIAYTTTWGAPYNTWSRRGGDTVIVHQNTYINNAPRTVVRRTANSSTSLFRDISGRCFERTIDSRGNESRIEIAASNCNF